MLGAILPAGCVPGFAGDIPFGGPSGSQLHMCADARRVAHDRRTAFWRDEAGGIAVVFAGDVFGRGSPMDIARDLATGFRLTGIDVLDQLDGFFTCLVFDLRSGEAVCAQDRHSDLAHFYYTPMNGGLAFANDIRELMRLTGSTARVDDRVLPQFLEFGYVPSGSTLFHGVSKLPADSILTCALSTGEFRIGRRPTRPRPQAQSDPLSTRKEYLRLFDDALAARLGDAANRETAFQISSGFDTNLIILRAVKLGLVDRVRALHVASRTPESEHVFVEQIVDTYRSMFGPVVSLDIGFVDNSDLQRLPSMVFAMGEPVYQTGVFLRERMARLANECGADLLLGGEGAGTIPLFRCDRLVEATQDEWIATYGGARFLGKDQLLDVILELRRVQFFQFFTANQRRRLLVSGVCETPEEPGNPDQLFCDYELLKFLQCRQFGIDMRMPYINRSLEAFASGLPYDLRRNKKIHRETVFEQLPPNARRLVGARPGHTPWWLLCSGNPGWDEMLAILPRLAAVRKYFSAEAVRDLVSESRDRLEARKEWAAHRLMTLLTFVVWHVLFIEQHVALTKDTCDIPLHQLLRGAAE